MLLLPAVFSILTGSAVAEAPFAPLANQPDYVVTMVESEYGKEVAARNVTHHGDWTRVDRIKDAYSVTEYFSADGLTNVRTDGQARSFPSSVAVSRIIPPSTVKLTIPANDRRFSAKTARRGTCGGPERRKPATAFLV
jgi:hypothetical protein